MVSGRYNYIRAPARSPPGGEVNKNYTVEKVAWKSGVFIIIIIFILFSVYILGGIHTDKPT